LVYFYSRSRRPNGRWRSTASGCDCRNNDADDDRADGGDSCKPLARNPVTGLRSKRTGTEGQCELERCGRAEHRDDQPRNHSYGAGRLLWGASSALDVSLLFQARRSAAAARPRHSNLDWSSSTPTTVSRGPV